jgi:hypothetical protein
MSNIIFVADVFAEHHLGGGELSNQELIRQLILRGHDVETKLSAAINIPYLQENRKNHFIIANFLGLPNEAMDFLRANCSYLIYEHDHKYLTTRDPSVFDNFLAPEEEVINRDFYSCAKGVFCQSKIHQEVAQKNLKLDNIYSVGGNLWDDETLDLLEVLSHKEKKDRYSIWDSTNPIKNTSLAAGYCTRKGFPYDLVGHLSYKQFLEKISDNKTLIFLPQTLETLCRVAVECRMTGMNVMTNKKLGATSEEWFSLKGIELISLMREKRNTICKQVEEILS